MFPILNKIIGNASGNIIKSVGEAIDTTFTNDDERLAKKNELTKIVGDNLTDVVNAQKDVLVAELNGSKLQRNWRPLTMLAFTFIIIYHYFLAPVFHLDNIELPIEFWDLLKLGMGGYVVGRSVEKVAETVTKNVDLPFIKRKDRGEEMK